MRYAAMSLDLDDKWSYMLTHGDPRWKDRPSYLDIFMPRIIEALNKHEFKVTFFIVGSDAERPANREALSLISSNGHDVGNHSQKHEVWLHVSGKDAIRREISEAERHIKAATSIKPIGFRGPGFVWSRDLIEVLSELGYEYDASSLPSYLNPFFKFLLTRKSTFSPEEREKRKYLFGTFRDGFRPIKPYYIPLPQGKRLLEVPVTTAPIIRTPFHMSYLLYLGQISLPLMLLYLRCCLMLCRLTGVTPSFLLHPLDLLSGEEAPELAFFPGMNIGIEKKTRLFNTAISELKKNRTLISLNQFARKTGGVA
jgi:hypothetical protein